MTGEAEEIETRNRGLWVRQPAEVNHRRSRLGVRLPKNQALAIAVVAGALSFVTALPQAVASIVSATVSSTDPKPVDCIAVVKKYDEFLGTDNGRITILTVEGPDEKAPLEADAEAVKCGIDGATLEQMVKTP